MSKKSQSPLPKNAEKPKEETLLNFSLAIHAVAGGAKIRRKEWSDPEEFALMKDSYLMIHRSKEGQQAVFHQWIVSEGDMLATDWVIVE